MALKATEENRTIVYDTSFDMSSQTSVTIKITHPGGSPVETVPDSRITTPGSSTTAPPLGTVAANEYMQFSTNSTDFPIEGTYTLCGTYNDTVAGDVFFGLDATLAVDKAC